MAPIICVNNEVFTRVGPYIVVYQQMAKRTWVCPADRYAPGERKWIIIKNTVLFVGVELDVTAVRDFVTPTDLGIDDGRSPEESVLQYLEALDFKNTFENL